MKKVLSFALAIGLVSASSLHAADASTQTIAKQEIIQEIQLFLEKSQRETIKDPFITTMFNKIDMIKTISDKTEKEKLLKHFESITFNPAAMFYFLPKEKTPKIHAIVEKHILQTTTSHAAIFLTKTDEFEVIHDKQENCCLILLPEKIMKKLSDEMIEQALYAHIVLNHPELGYNSFGEKIDQWFQTIKTIGLITLCSVGALAGIWFFPQTSLSLLKFLSKHIVKGICLTIPITVATFVALSDYFENKEKNVNHKNEYEADLVSAQLHDKSNILNYFKKDTQLMENTFNEYQEAHDTLLQEITSLKHNYSDFAKKREEELLENLTEKIEIFFYNHKEAHDYLTQKITKLKPNYPDYTKKLEDVVLKKLQKKNDWERKTHPSHKQRIEALES